MKNEYRGVFEGLGYDVDTKGALFFGELIEDARELLKEGKSEEEVKEILPGCYTEYYHFVYEGIGRENYLNALDSFFTSRKDDQAVKFFASEFMGFDSCPSKEDLLVFFAKKFNKMENKRNKVRILIDGSNCGVVVTK